MTATTSSTLIPFVQPAAPIVAHKETGLLQDDFGLQGFEMYLEQFMDDHYSEDVNRPLDELLDEFFIHHSHGKNRDKLEAAIERLKINTDMLHVLLRSKSLRQKLSSRPSSNQQTAKPSANLLQAYLGIKPTKQQANTPANNEPKDTTNTNHFMVQCEEFLHPASEPKTIVAAA
jgi:hypothetical protein